MPVIHCLKIVLFVPFLLVSLAFGQDQYRPSSAETSPDLSEEIILQTEEGGSFTNPMWTGAFQLQKRLGMVSISGKFTLPPVPSIELPFLLWLDQGDEPLAPEEDVYLSCKSRTWGEFTKENTLIRVTAFGDKLALVVEQLPGESEPVTVYFGGGNWKLGEGVLSGY